MDARALQPGGKVGGPPGREILHCREFGARHHPVQDPGVIGAHDAAADQPDLYDHARISLADADCLGGAAVRDRRRPMTTRTSGDRQGGVPGRSGRH